MSKLLTSVTAIFMAAIVFSGCTTNSPKDVAQKWLNAFYHADYENAKKYSTDATRNLISLVEQFDSLKTDSVKEHIKKLKVDIKDVKEKGDTAMVTYVVSEVPKDQKLRLVKQNGKWLVAKSKVDDLSDEDRSSNTPPAPDNSTAPPADAPPADTTPPAK